MSCDDELYWLETYFILFSRKQRPALAQVSESLRKANMHFELENPAADSEGLFDSILVESPEDHAAVEISYATGDAIIEQNLVWAKQLKSQLSPAQLQHLIKSDARLEVAHFERMSGSGPEPVGNEFGGGFDDDFGDEFSDDFEGPDGPNDMLDPTCLLTVVETLARLTDGLTFDPAAGEIVG